MKTIIIKLFVIICCGDYAPDGTYQYEARCLDDKTTYKVYTTAKYSVGDTLRYTTQINETQTTCK